MARILTFLIPLLCSLALADKAPGFDSQVAGSGYKVSQELPKHSKDLGGGYAPPAASAAPAPSYTSFDYNSINQGKDLSGGFAAPSFGPSAFSGAASNPSAASYGAPDASYGPPSGGVHGGNTGGYPAAPQGNHENAYTYYYQHYPAGNRPGHGISPGDESIFDGLGDGFGLAGLGGLGGLGGVLAVAKGLIALKPLLLIGLALLLAIPILLFFLPIPIITVSNLPSLGGSGGDGNASRQYGPQGMFSTYLSTISDRVLNSEECLERIICKLPQAPNKFQGKAKILWETYGKKYFTNMRLHRAMNAYFDESAGRSRISKCNQKFKCSNKFF